MGEMGCLASLSGISKIIGMAGEAAESLEREGGQKLDHLLIELRKDAEELNLEQRSGKREIILEGLSDIDEVIRGLERLRQLLIRC